MTNKVEKRIALCIIRAQKSSDKGKGINRISLSKSNARPCCLGYGFKEQPILEAIKLIESNKTQFNFWVTEAPDQNGVLSILVYFDFILDGMRYQVSFHNHGAKQLKKYINKGRKTRWYKKHSSYYSCIKLQEYYKISQAVVESEEVSSETSQRDENRRKNYSGRRTSWC